MTKSELASFPVYDLQVDQVKFTFSKVGAAIAKREYQEAVEFASATLVEIHELLLLTVLEHRAYALGMQGKFDEAVKDAKSMIAYMPTAATGYFRLGSIYEMQGKHLSAVLNYDMGLQFASVDHPYHALMLKGRETATRKSRACVDFVARLPVEVVDEIITLLPSRSKSACLIISSVWRNKIFMCSNTWRTLISGSGAREDWTTALIPYIGAHVEDLTINTKDRRVFLRYLHCMNTGYFTKIKSLRLEGSATNHITVNILLPVGNVFWNIRNTVTKLILHIDQSSGVIALLDLLTVCSNLKTLEYATKSPLSAVIGELAPPHPQNALIDLHLVAKSITRLDVEVLLPHCNQIRRLLLNGCEASVLDIIDKVSPFLRIFGFNARPSSVPELDRSDIESTIPGLYQFYTYNGGAKEPASAVLPLLRKNMHSLRTVYVNISAERSQSNLVMMYADLELNRLESLTFRGDDSNIIQPLLLRSISTCSTLTSVAAIASRDIAGLINTLSALPQLESLEIAYDSRSTLGETDIIRLLEKYAMDPQPKQRLAAICFRNCRAIVTDNVLDALAGVYTVRKVRFEGLTNVSAHGIDKVFKKLGKNLSDIKLSEMDIIVDSSLNTIGRKVKDLKRISLERLKNVSDDGILDLINRLPNLQSLALIKCESVTPTCIAYAKKKVKSVVIT